MVGDSEPGDPCALPHHAVIWADGERLVLGLRARKNRLFLCFGGSIAIGGDSVAGYGVELQAVWQQVGPSLLVPSVPQNVSSTRCRTMGQACGLRGYFFL